MVHRIHILGASGSGTTMSGRVLAEHLHFPHFDTDDYFWQPTDLPLTQQRERTARQQLLMNICCGDLSRVDAFRMMTHERILA
jgi:adenylate kinase family enzyme